jgi:hypothetical protein
LCLVRFGGDEIWIFRQVLAIDLPCTREVFGDLTQPSLKDSDVNCYVTFFDNSSVSWSEGIKENHHFTLANVSEVRYGSPKHNIWAYGLFANDTFKCDADLVGYFPGGVLGDKECQIGQVFPEPVFDQPLADPGKPFSLLEADAIFSVYHGSYIAEVASTASLTCNPSQFGQKGFASAPCGLIAGYPIQFDDPVAEWFQAESCAGTSSCSYTLSEGVTSTTTSSTSEYWSASLAATTSGGMTYKGGTVGGQLTGTISASLTLMQSQAYSMSITQACAASCQPLPNQTVVLWQWVITTDELDFDPKLLPRISNPFQTLVCAYLCLPDGIIPNCPPGYCSDSNCQICSVPLFT